MSSLDCFKSQVCYSVDTNHTRKRTHSTHTPDTHSHIPHKHTHSHIPHTHTPQDHKIFKHFLWLLNFTSRLTLFAPLLAFNALSMSSLCWPDPYSDTEREREGGNERESECALYACVYALCSLWMAYVARTALAEVAQCSWNWQLIRHYIYAI